MSKQHLWSYKQQESEIENGPVGEAEFVALVKNGTIEGSTLVRSSTRTKNAWVPAKRISGIQKFLDPQRVEKATVAQGESSVNPYAAPDSDLAASASPIQNAEAKTIYERFRPLNASALLWLLRTTIFAMAINGFLIWCLYQFGASSNSPIAMAQAAIYFIQVVSMIATAIFFLRWKYRAYANLQVACTNKLKTTAGWCCACYFIPILNLFRPPMAMHEVQARSKANVGTSVYCGWFLFILCFVLARVKAKTIGGVLDVRICILEIAGLSLLIIGSFLLLRIIRTVTEKQARYRRALEANLNN